jgi:hypothetical protein
MRATHGAGVRRQAANVDDRAAGPQALRHARADERAVEDHAGDSRQREVDSSSDDTPRTAALLTRMSMRPKLLTASPCAPQPPGR